MVMNINLVSTTMIQTQLSSRNETHLRMANIMLPKRRENDPSKDHKYKTRIENTRQYNNIWYSRIHIFLGDIYKRS